MSETDVETIEDQPAPADATTRLVLACGHELVVTVPAATAHHCTEHGLSLVINRHEHGKE
jgi:hypothetical protein